MRFYKPRTGNSALPELTNPAVAKNIKKNLEAINGAGEKMTGKLQTTEIYTKNGVALPLTWGANSEGLECGTLTDSAGDATAVDLAEGKTATVDGGKVTGTVEVEASAKVVASPISANVVDIPDSSPAGSHKVFELSHTLKTPLLFRAKSRIHLQYPLSSFGDAIASDVRAGKTFTSKDGFLKTGTLNVSGFDTTQFLAVKPLGYDELNVTNNLQITNIPDWQLCYMKKADANQGSFYTPEDLPSYSVGGDSLTMWVDIEHTTNSITLTAKAGQDDFKIRQVFSNIIIFYPYPTT